MTKYKRIFSQAVASLFVAVLLPSCVSEDSSSAESRGVTFAAAIGRESKVDTRAGIVFNPVPSDYKDTPFYVHAEVATGEGLKDELAEYNVASGMLGRLVAKDADHEILWYNKKDFHTFYAWTMPWQKDDLFLTDPNAPSEVSFLPSTYQKMESLSAADRLNCGVMERFVATKTHSLAYNINGELVEMYFQHLVSKININATRLVGDGTNYSREEVEAEMTFLDMPQKGTFYRRPADGSPADGRAPYVEKVEDGATGVTCWIGNGSTTLYVCPEVDFSNMRFAIHFNAGDGNRGDYYGDFKSVIFKRQFPDEELGNWDEDKKTTVLYAGEEMTINLALRNDEATNFTVTINPWTDKYREGISHAKKGVYTLTELQDIYNKFAGGNYTDADVQEIFDLFGVEEDGQWFLYMYEDLETTHGHFPLDPKFILDGLGHILQMRNTTRTFPDKKKHEYCAQVPCCRNIFLTNGDGKHMIYIDDEYHIWIVDPDTLEMKDSGHDLEPIPLPKGQKSYFIDYETGEVDTSSTV